MIKKEAKIQEALGTMFTCVNCDKVKTMPQKSDGGIYMIDNFCEECKTGTLPLSERMILSERTYKVGYVVREEWWDDRDFGGHGIFVKNAYTLSGNHIGSSKWAHRLCKIYGIVPEPSDVTDSGCSIGYSEKNKKYYGWSHRAIFGFAIGDKIFQERFGNDKTELTQHGKKTIRTKVEQRKAAIAFADYVG